MEKIEMNEEELGFLNEIINIGSGNAAGALEQLLGTTIDMEIPVVSILSPPQLSNVMGSIPEPAIVNMGILGDIKGRMFFIVSRNDIKIITELTEKANPQASGKKLEPDWSVIEEIGNIMAGVCLYSIHDFCGLNAYHTVPDLSTDKLSGMKDEMMIAKMKLDPNFICIETSFKVNDSTKIPIFCILVLMVDSISRLKTAIQYAKEKMYGT
jgi:chemotaxis protein CheC